MKRPPHGAAPGGVGVARVCRAILHYGQSRAVAGPLAVLSRFRLCGVFSAPRRAARKPRRNYD
ncbi:hypothetical protein L494_1350 [Bordetella bronchiseptica CA90 BB1334]|nr:hypothetical protein L494_1350 [Bordetella bronchiseptica CA90 BB1334]KDC94328.1 hypothetical protein L517_1341 [Bordetella bronchiseptica MBORD670]KDD46311.1 hypothetical protein L532_1348 [Bordetella bronchiseptica OSU095]